MYWESGGAGSLGRLPHTIAHTSKAPSFLLLPPAAPRDTKCIFPWETSAFTCAATWTCESLPTQYEQHSLLSLHLWQCCLVPTSSLLPMEPAWIQTPGKQLPPWVPDLVRWSKLGPCPLLTVFKLALHLAVRDLIWFFSTSPFNVLVCCSKCPST